MCRRKETTNTNSSSRDRKWVTLLSVDASKIISKHLPLGMVVLHILDKLRSQYLFFFKKLDLFIIVHLNSGFTY